MPQALVLEQDFHTIEGCLNIILDAGNSFKMLPKFETKQQIQWQHIAVYIATLQETHSMDVASKCPNFLVTKIHSRIIYSLINFLS